MRVRSVPLLLAILLPACGDAATTTGAPEDDAAADVTLVEDVAADTAAPPSDVAEETSAADSTAPDVAAGGDASADGAPKPDAGGETASDAKGDTPTCTPAGAACGASGACCPGNTCVDGLCRSCVPKGGFCTWGTADRCCSGSCDGDSCNGYPVGHACSSNAQCQLNNCVGGVCACALGDAPCGAAGACVDIEYNDAHCGACGKACGPNQRCLAGKCECRDAWLTNCGADCYDTRIEEAHCGACGKTCRADQLCIGSACQCATGTECKGACLTFGSDPSNCGSCGNACPSDHPRCSAGVCVCAAGLTQCPTGCLNLGTDSANCGACGNACKGAKTCVGGVCL